MEKIHCSRGLYGTVRKAHGTDFMPVVQHYAHVTVLMHMALYLPTWTTLPLS